MGIIGDDVGHELGLHRPESVVLDRQARLAAAVADGLIGRAEALAPVIGLLLGDAVEADGATGKSIRASVPDRLAEAFAALVRSADVEADEAEFAAIGHRRDRRDHFVADKGADEAFGVRGLEPRRVFEARVPAFRCRPVDEDRQFLQRQRADGWLHCAHSAATAPGEKDFSTPR